MSRSGAEKSKTIVGAALLALKSERAAVVEYLRDWADAGDSHFAAQALRHTADAIERGDHRK